MLIAVPYHLGQRLESFDLGVAPDVEVTAVLPATVGPWQRMSVLYEQVAEAVAQATTPPVIVSGDCTTSLGVLTGLQRTRRELAIVWLDAHADFDTEASTMSGYLGGLPPALAVGLGTLTLPEALGLRPIPQSRAMLVDAGDTDPGEQELRRRGAARPGMFTCTSTSMWPIRKTSRTCFTPLRTVPP